MFINQTSAWRASRGAITAAVLSLAAACAPTAPPPPLADALRDVEGRFVANPLTEAPDYTARAEIERILAPRPAAQTRRELAACIDDMRPSRSMSGDRAAPTGVICHLALTQTIYHEPTGPDGDIAADWAGFVAPDADADALRAARAAWEKVLRDGTWRAL